MLPEGELVIWKACKSPCLKNVYVRLIVSLKAKRVTVNSKNYKSRVEYAFVDEIIDNCGNKYSEAISLYIKWELF